MLSTSPFYDEGDPYSCCDHYGGQTSCLPSPSRGEFEGERLLMLPLEEERLLMLPLGEERPKACQIMVAIKYGPPQESRVLLGE